MNYDFDWSDAFATNLFSVSDLLLFTLLLIASTWFLFQRHHHHTIVGITSYFAASNLILPFLIFFPFAFSPANVIATGLNQDSLIPYLNKAFSISVLGTVCFLVATAFRIKSPISTVLVSITSRSICNFWLSRFANCTCLLALIFAMLYLVELGAHFGNAREFALDNRSISFLFNSYNEIAAFSLFNATVYAGLTRKPVDVIVAILIFILSLFLGTRSSSLLTLLTALLAIGITIGYQNFLVPILIIFVLLACAILLALFRDANAGSIDLAILLTNIFFGNNFSDVRDFAWLMSGWDGTLLFGQTFFAGLLSFIPSSLYPDRTVWGWGAFSAALSGLDAQSHPGLRPGLFGEMYFNFGIIGVILSSTLAGLFISSVDRLSISTRESTILSARRKFATVYACVQIGLAPLYAFNSAGFFGLYVKILLLAFGLIISRSANRRPLSVTSGTT